MESLYLITGSNGCGKDFFFKHLHELDKYYTFTPEFKLINPPEEYQRLAFADPIKRSLGVPEELLTQSGIPRQDIIDRADLIKSNMGDDIFVNIVVSTIWNNKINNVVVTDLRFNNELEKIKKYFPHVVVIAIEDNPHKFKLDHLAKKLPP